MKLFVAIMMSAILGAQASEGSTFKAPRPGLYAGFLVLQEQPEVPSGKFPVTLEFLNIRSSIASPRTPLLAFLKVQQGQFHGPEYVTYFYTVDAYDWEKGSFSFDVLGKQNSKDLVVKKGKVENSGMGISAEVESLRAGLLAAELLLIHEDTENFVEEVWKLAANVPTFQPITGNYLGVCDDGNALSMQIEATKDSGFGSDSQSQFQGYQITSRKMILNSETGNFEMYLTFDEPGIFRSSFDLYTRRLNLPRLQKQGVVLHDRLGCGQCTFFPSSDRENVRALFSDKTDFFKFYYFSDETPEKGKKPWDLRKSDSLRNLYAGRRDPRPSAPAATWANTASFSHSRLTNASPDEQIQGRFVGGVRMEERGAFESMMISVDISPAQDHERQLHFSARIVVNGNDGFDRKVIGFRYAPVALANDHIPLEPIFVGEGDGILALEYWSRDHVSGTLYSKSAARVGRFAAAREGFADPPEMGLPPAHPLAGSYELLGRRRLSSELLSSRLDLWLISAASGHERPDYFPFHLQGSLVEQYEIDLGFGLYKGRRRPVLKRSMVAGRFDPFTGSMAVEFDDGVVMTGKHTLGLLAMFQSIGNRDFNKTPYQNVRLFGSTTKALKLRPEDDY